MVTIAMIPKKIFETDQIREGLDNEGYFLARQLKLPAADYREL
jgi:hypothetical protein